MTIRSFDRAALVQSIIETAESYGLSGKTRANPALLQAHAARLLMDVIVAVEPLATSGAERRSLASEMLRAVIDKLGAACTAADDPDGSAAAQTLDIWRAALLAFDNGMDLVLVQSLQDTRVLRANAGCFLSLVLRLLSAVAGRSHDGSRRRGSVQSTSSPPPASQH